MPKSGLSMQEGTIVDWLVPEGHAIEQGDEIVEIETEKVNNSHEAPCAGLLRRRVAQSGQTVPVKGLIGVVAPASVSDDEIDNFVTSFAAAFVPEAAEDKDIAPQTIEIAGRSINYLDTGGGDGLPLLLVHGICADLSSWMFNQPMLYCGRRVIALDLPGHGANSKDVGAGYVSFSADVIDAFLEALEIPRAHIAGHSLGGAVAIAFTLNYPDRIASLGLIAPAALAPEINAQFLAELIGAEKRRGARVALSKLVHEPNLVSRDMIKQFLRYKRTDGVAGALAVIADAAFDGDRQRTVLTDRLGEIGVPIIGIWGEQNQVILPSQAANLPVGTALHRLDDAGHLAHMEKAIEVNALLATHATESGANSPRRRRTA